MKGLLLPLLFAGASAQTDCGTLLITEIADPNSPSGNRYVELFSFTGADLSYYALRRWTNGNDSPQSTDVALSGTVSAGGYFIVCNNKDTFDSTYSTTCDLDIGTGGPADSNGDDQIALVDTTTDTVIDLFGVPGEDGTGTGHEFEDGRAERASFVTCGSATWVEAEWNIDNDGGAGDGALNAPDGFDPASWIGDPNTASADSPPPSPPMPPTPPPPPSPVLVSADIAIIQGGYDTANECGSSFMVGTLVGVYGYVTAIKYNGFWLSSNHVAALYEGIFVFTDSADISSLYVGMSLHVSGDVIEYFDLTEIEVVATNDQHGFFPDGADGGSVMIGTMVTSTGAIGTACSETGEAHEGILVTVYNAEIKGEADNYGQIEIDDGSGPTELEDSLLDTDYTTSSRCSTPPRSRAP